MCLAIPARIVAVDRSDPAAPTATVDSGGTVRQVLLTYAPEAAVGGYVIVHAGFATRLVPESEAREAIEYFRALRTAAAAAGGPTGGP